MASEISAACCRQLYALPDQGVRSVGWSDQVNSNWSELWIDDVQNIHNRGSVSEEFADAMEVCLSQCMTLPMRT